MGLLRRDGAPERQRPARRSAGGTAGGSRGAGNLTGCARRSPRKLSRDSVFPEEKNECINWEGRTSGNSFPKQSSLFYPTSHLATFTLFVFGADGNMPKFEPYQNRHKIGMSTPIFKYRALSSSLVHVYRKESHRLNLVMVPFHIFRGKTQELSFPTLFIPQKWKNSHQKKTVSQLKHVNIGSFFMATNLFGLERKYKRNAT